MKLKCFFLFHKEFGRLSIFDSFPSPRALTSYFKLLQVTIVLGAVEEETSLAFGALDEAIGSQKLLHHACLSNARPCAVGVCSVPIVMEHTWVKTHLGKRRSKY